MRILCASWAFLELHNLLLKLRASTGFGIQSFSNFRIVECMPCVPWDPGAGSLRLPPGNKCISDFTVMCLALCVQRKTLVQVWSPGELLKKKKLQISGPLGSKMQRGTVSTSTVRSEADFTLGCGA